ncbi:MAG TPA: Asp-tRNA(Asn)/Glu-tRNA(Gln) amidotransferase subunit GatA [Actinomycetota bacterium]|nr:Asp-tRNA(Asn)/Glu-tRNA(Gln) amidotransferase subunit GatA [Actinomycetota bacterium]
MSELWELPAAELGEKIARKELRAREAVDAHLARIEALDDSVNAFLTLTPDLARATADDVDRRIDAGEKLGPLAGVPLALKDILCVDGVRTTAGSKILESYAPPYDATVVKKLNAAGIPIVGKANLDEFAMGSSTENSAYGPSHNPWDLARVPGGSSGGSAAAVAAGFAPLGIGTDTGGSIRQPASLCGVVGVKPTYGLVSRYGVLAFASSLDQVGPFARTVEDAAMLLDVIAGHDTFDATSIPGARPDYRAGLNEGVGGLKIGVVSDWIEGEGVEPGVSEKVRAAIDALAGLGAEIGEISLPSFRYALSAYYLIAPAECSSNLARYDGVRWGLRAPNAKDVIEMNVKSRTAGFGEEVKRRIMLGTYALSAGYYDAYYGKAQQVRTLVIRDFDKAYEKFDVLLGPTSPTTAFKLGEKTDDPLAMYLNDVFTIPSNLAGAAAISVPCGLSEGLPVGLQLLGPPQSEGLLFKVAYAYEQARGPLQTPGLWAKS